jgi:hypothetical protein
MDQRAERREQRGGSREEKAESDTMSKEMGAERREQRGGSKEHAPSAPARGGGS